MFARIAGSAALAMFVLSWPFAAIADDSETLAAAIEAKAEALEALAAVPPKADYDVAALAASLSGSTPESLRSWVATHTVETSYRGLLRGAQGTLEARRGNSLDRAMLLGALLAENHFQVRLARATLSADQTASLRAALAQDRYLPSPDVDPAATSAIVDRLEADPRVDGEAMKAADAKRASSPDTSAEDVALVVKEANALTALVQSRLAPVAADEAALADHWWVQVEDGGSWKDVDPDAERLGAVAATSTLELDAVPAELRHHVSIGVVAEIAHEGKLSTAIILKHDWDTAEISGQIFDLTLTPMGLPKMDEVKDAGELTIALSKATAWLPVLSADATYTQSIVTASGEVVEASQANIDKYNKAGLTGAYGDMAHGLDQLGGDAQPVSGDVLTAEWIEFEIVSPGSSVRTERRMIFDAIGPEARATGTFEGTLSDDALRARGANSALVMSIAIEGGLVSPARTMARLSMAMAKEREAAVEWLRAGMPAEGPQYSSGFRSPSAELALYGLSRDQADRTASPELSATNIAALREDLQIDGDQLILRRVFDIIANPVLGEPGAQIRAGVGDTLLEHRLMSGPEGAINTAVRFNADLDAGSNWQVLAPGDEAKLAGLAGTPAVSAMLKEELAAGDVLVAPNQFAAAGATWWRVDPHTGKTIGMTAAGGANITETAIVIGTAIVFSYALLTYECRKMGGAKKGEGPLACVIRHQTEDLKKKMDGPMSGLSTASA